MTKKKGTNPDLEAEDKAEDPVELETGGVRTTDPAFADGAMETDGTGNPWPKGQGPEDA